MPDKVAPVEDLILEVHNAHRLFDPTHALKGVSCQVRRGEVLALLGPNGAGKTTLGKIVAGQDAPEHGRITYYFEDLPPTSSPDPAQIGCFPGDSTYYQSLAVERLLYHAASKRGMDRTEAAEATHYWLERLGLSARPQTPLANLSKGNQQKVQFAESVLHGPALAYLDEPFAGLDPVNQEWFLSVMRELQATGMTLIISDHHMHLIERVADRMLIMYQGRIVASGTLQDLRTRAQAGSHIRVRVIDPRAVDLAPFQAHRGIRAIERTASGEIRLLTRADSNTTEIMNLAKSRLRIAEIFAEPASLHDIYVQVFHNPPAEPPAAASNDLRPLPQAA